MRSATGSWCDGEGFVRTCPEKTTAVWLHRGSAAAARHRHTAGRVKAEGTVPCRVHHGRGRHRHRCQTPPPVSTIDSILALELCSWCFVSAPRTSCKIAKLLRRGGHRRARRRRGRHALRIAIARHFPLHANGAAHQCRHLAVQLPNSLRRWPHPHLCAPCLSPVRQNGECLSTRDGSRLWRCLAEGAGGSQADGWCSTLLADVKPLLAMQREHEATWYPHKSCVRSLHSSAALRKANRRRFRRHIRGDGMPPVPSGRARHRAAPPQNRPPRQARPSLPSRPPPQPP
jgi:hypothetical protein